MRPIHLLALCLAMGGCASAPQPIAGTYQPVPVNGTCGYTAAPPNAIYYPQQPQAQIGFFDKAQLMSRAFIYWCTPFAPADWTPL